MAGEVKSLTQEHSAEAAAEPGAEARVPPQLPDVSLYSPDHTSDFRRVDNTVLDSGLSFRYELESLQKLQSKKQSINAKHDYYSTDIGKITAVCICFSVFVGFMLFQHSNSF